MQSDMGAAAKSVAKPPNPPIAFQNSDDAIDKDAMARNQALDVAKGVAIIAVVISHAMRGMRDDGLLSDGVLFQMIDAALYLFHVQLFLLISGYLAFSGARKPDAQRKRQISLAYSYFLWSALSLMALIVMHGKLPSPNITQSFISLIYRPIQHFWFIPIIMIGYSLLYIFRRVPVLIFIMAFFLMIPTIFGFGYYGIHYYVPFYLFGAILYLNPMSAFRNIATDISAASLFVIGIILAGYKGEFLPTSTQMIPFSLAACYTVYTVCEIISRRTGFGQYVAFIGRASLPIYLTHVFFVAADRQLGIAIMGRSGPGLLLISCILLGVFGPIILDYVMSRMKLRRVVGFIPLLK